MLRLFLSAKNAEEHPWWTLLVAFIYASISIFFAVWIFPDYASVAMIFLTVFSSLYMIQGAIRIEESKEENYKTEKWILKEHSKIIKLFIFIFIGFTIAFAFWAFVLPEHSVESMFSLQNNAVNSIKSSLSGSFFEANTIIKIFVNNTKVLLISLIFGVFYGAGAIYVLVWNASVMGFVIGNLAKDTFGIIAVPIAFTKYFIHGIPEMVSYFGAALAGGLIYVAFWRGDLKNSARSKKLFFDALIIMIISLLLLAASSLIEIFISPHI